MFEGGGRREEGGGWKGDVRCEKALLLPGMGSVEWLNMLRTGHFRRVAGIDF
jgi:hypothetical protein